MDQYHINLASHEQGPSNPDHLTICESIFEFSLAVSLASCPSSTTTTFFHFSSLS